MLFADRALFRNTSTGPRSLRTRNYRLYLVSLNAITLYRIPSEARDVDGRWVEWLKDELAFQALIRKHGDQLLNA